MYNDDVDPYDYAQVVEGLMYIENLNQGERSREARKARLDLEAGSISLDYAEEVLYQVRS